MKTLDDLFKQMKCDKSTLHHGYAKEYENVLKHYKDKQIRILEIGIFNGTSMSAFLEYLPYAEVYGIDIFTRLKPSDVPILQHERAYWLKADSLSTDLPQLIYEKFGDVKFDIIIDDGLHTPEANLKTFKNCFPLLKKGGTYYIEDVWPLHKMNKNEKQHHWIVNHPNDYVDEKHNELMKELMKESIKEIDLRKQSGNPDSYIFKIKKT